MRVFDIFCGCGGFGIAAQQSGCDIAMAIDNDKYAIQSYIHNVGNHAILSDIRDIKGADIPKCDMWLFGFPCSNLSVAGKQEGIDGDKSGMFFEVMRLLDEVSIKPFALIAENVKGLRKYLPVLEWEFAMRGYKMYYALYNSKYWGVPQNRERYYIVGLRDDTPFEMPTQLTENVPILRNFLDADVGEKYYLTDEKAQTIIKNALERVALKETHACITPDRVDKRQNGRRAKDDNEPMFTLTAQDMHGIICKETGMNNPNGINKTLRVGGRITLTAVNGGLHHAKIFDYSCYRVRRLTPNEYRKLQGFPNTWEQIVSDSQAYKQFGNAVSVPVAKAVIESVVIHLK